MSKIVIILKRVLKKSFLIIFALLLCIVNVVNTKALSNFDTNIPTELNIDTANMVNPSSFDNIMSYALDIIIYTLLIGMAIVIRKQLKKVSIDNHKIEK